MNVKKRTLAIMVCCLALIVGAVGVTVAWLTDKTDTVTNTFTVGNVEIFLDETKVNETGDVVKDNENKDVRTTEGNSYKVIPGFTYLKDPTVTVKADSEDCYLFVKFVQGDASKYYDYDSVLDDADGGWIQGTGDVEGGNKVPIDVWFRVVKNGDSVKSWKLLNGDSITVRDTVTKETMSAAAEAKLIYTAYAVQLYKTNSDKFSPEDAWAEASR